MTKQTKMLVGVSLVGVATYLIWKSQQPKVTANASGKSGKTLGGISCNKGCKDGKCVWNGRVLDCKEATMNFPTGNAYGN